MKILSPLGLQDDYISVSRYISLHHIVTSCFNISHNFISPTDHIIGSELTLSRISLARCILFFKIPLQFQGTSTMNQQSHSPNLKQKIDIIPICSMSRIFTNICPKNHPSSRFFLEDSALIMKWHMQFFLDRGSGAKCTKGSFWVTGCQRVFLFLAAVRNLEVTWRKTGRSASHDHFVGLTELAIVEAAAYHENGSRMGAPCVSTTTCRSPGD